MLADKRSAGVTQEINLKNPLHTSDKAHKRGIHPGFEAQGRRHQKSKTGIRDTTKRTYVLQKKRKKKKKRLQIIRIQNVNVPYSVILFILFHSVRYRAGI